MTAQNRPDLYSDFEYLGSASGYADDVYEVLSHEVLFEDFSHPEIEVLCQFMQCYAAPRGAALIEEGREGDFLLIVLTGQVEVRKIAVNSAPVGMAVIGPGGIIGEMSLIDGERRFASCVALEPVDFAVMTRTDLNEILIMHPRLANKFLIKILEIMVNRMRDTGLRAINPGGSPLV